MKLIGMTKGGSVIMEINLSEARNLSILAEALSDMAKLAPPPVQPEAPVTDPEEILPRRTQRARREASRKTEGKEKRSRDKVCVVCGKAFRDRSKTNVAKACKAKCRKILRASHGKLAKAESNKSPVGVRTMDKETRLALIKSRAERSPLDTAAELHQRMQDQDAG